MSFVSPVVYDNSLNSLEDKDNAIQHHSHSSHQHQHQSHRRGRRRKEEKKQQLDESLKEKVNAALRIHKLKTTQELAQQFNIELESKSNALNDSQTLTVERIASSLDSKSHSHYKKNAVSNCDADDETKTSKSELMHRFLSSTSAHDDSIDIGIDDELGEHCLHNHEHYSNYYRNDGLCSHQSTAKTKSIDSVGDEIRDILSQLPPLNLSEIAWSDSDLNETNNDVNNDDINIDSDDDHNQQTKRCRARDREVSESHVTKLNGDYKWEYVNGTYDSETDWKEWHHMSSAVSYNGELLHILPYVNIKD